MMKNKVLVEVLVPVIEKKYDVYLPVNKRIGNIINLLCKAIEEFTNGMFTTDTSISLYSSATGVKYNINDLLRKTDIRNGSILVLM